MPDVARGFLTVFLATLLGILVPFTINFIADEPLEPEFVLLIGGLFGLLYGLEAGILLSYPLTSFKGFFKLIIDFTWSLPNTIFGFILGNIIYVFFGWPSGSRSKGQGFIAFAPRSSTTTLGNNVYQTLGTVNIGGAGAHELIHVLQARIFGPLFLPLFGMNYVINFFVQIIFMSTIGLVLWLLKVRSTPYFRPPSNSAVGGNSTSSGWAKFFGWIYFANFFELWAYATEK